MGTGHHHGPGPDHHGHARHGGNERAIGLAALLIGSFMLAEVAGGLISGSLALLADAGHMLTDFGSLVLAWFAFRLARRPANWKRTYGFDRFSVLAAFVNGLSLFAISGWITVEAVQRLLEPAEVLGGVMLWVGVGGLVVNVLAFWVLSRGEQSNLNVRAAALHVIGDLLGSVAAIAGALIILGTGWTAVDPILSLMVVLIILRSAWGIVCDSAHILLEGAPEGVDPREVAADLVRHVRGVVRVHHVHAWSITQERPMVTLEAELVPGTETGAAGRAIKARLAERFDVGHSTVELCEAAGEPEQFMPAETAPSGGG